MHFPDECIEFLLADVKAQTFGCGRFLQCAVNAGVHIVVVLTAASSGEDEQPEYNKGRDKNLCFHSREIKMNTVYCINAPVE